MGKQTFTTNILEPVGLKLFPFSFLKQLLPFLAKHTDNIFFRSSFDPKCSETSQGNWLLKFEEASTPLYGNLR